MFVLNAYLVCHDLCNYSRKRFSETQAEQWWQENRARVYQQYNVRVVDKSTTSVDNDIASH
jgi:hypothetical protein